MTKSLKDFKNGMSENAFNTMLIFIYPTNFNGVDILKHASLNDVSNESGDNPTKRLAIIPCFKRTKELLNKMVMGDIPFGYTTAEGYKALPEVVKRHIDEEMERPGNIYDTEEGWGRSSWEPGNLPGRYVP